MRRSLLLAAAAFVASAIPAIACSPPPPPDWEGWAAPTNDVFSGRVVSLTPESVSMEHDIRIRRAMMRILRLKSFEGRQGPDTVDASVIIEVLDANPSAGGLCLSPVGYQPGDTVLVIRRSGVPPRVFHPVWAQNSRFASLFEKQ